MKTLENFGRRDVSYNLFLSVQKKNLIPDTTAHDFPNLPCRWHSVPRRMSSPVRSELVRQPYLKTGVLSRRDRGGIHVSFHTFGTGTLFLSGRLR